MKVEDLLNYCLESREGDDKLPAKDWAKFENSADGKSATLYLYREIGGFFGDGAEDIKEDLQTTNAKTIHVRINSGGGSVFEGHAIYNLLRNSSAKIITHNDGIAGSIAAMIFLAGDERRAAKNSVTMIHRPSGGAQGNVEDLLVVADALVTIEEILVDTLEERSTMERSAIMAAIAKTSWYKPSVAMENGLATHIDEPMKAAASLDGLREEVPEDIVDFINEGRQADSDELTAARAQIEAIQAKFANL